MINEIYKDTLINITDAYIYNKDTLLKYKNMKGLIYWLYSSVFF